MTDGARGSHVGGVTRVTGVGECVGVVDVSGLVGMSCRGMPFGVVGMGPAWVCLGAHFNADARTWWGWCGCTGPRFGTGLWGGRFRDWSVGVVVVGTGLWMVTVLGSIHKTPSVEGLFGWSRRVYDKNRDGWMARWRGVGIWRWGDGPLGGWSGLPARWRAIRPYLSGKPTELVLSSTRAAIRPPVIPVRWEEVA